MRQLIISEVSDPGDIELWLETRTRDIVLVVAARVTETVRECVQMAGAFSLPISFLDPLVQQELFS